MLLEACEHSGWKTGYLLRDEGLACFDGARVHSSSM